MYANCDDMTDEAELKWRVGLSHASWILLHSFSSYVGSWHADPSGTVLMRRPSTVLFNAAQSLADGQHESVGAHRQVVLAAVAAVTEPNRAKRGKSKIILIFRCVGQFFQ